MKAFAIFLLLSAPLITACEADIKVKRVGSHVFAVPKDYLVTPNIFWLSSAQAEGLMFVINPDASPQEQILILVETGEQVCQGRDSSPELRSFCTSSEPNERYLSVGAGAEVKKVFPEGGKIQSSYLLAGSDLSIAGCTESANKLTDLGAVCYSLFRYKDLAFKINFREANLQRLPSFMRSAENLLSSWESRRGLPGKPD